MENYGLKASIDGEDVHSTDPLKLGFSSGLPTPLIHAQGIATISMGVGINNAWIEVFHTLGYIPVAIAFVEIAANQKQLMVGNFDGTRKWELIAFSNKIRLYGEDGSRGGGSPAVTFDCYYYIFADQVA